MSIRPAALPAAALLAAALPLLAAGCGGPAGETRADAIDRAACRQRAEDVSRMQDPAAVYRADEYATSSRDAPFGSNGAPNVAGGLSSSFAWQRMVDDCINDRPGNVGTSPAAPPEGEGAKP